MVDSELNMKFEKCYCGNSDYKIFRDFGERKVIECKSCGLLRSFPLPANSVCDDTYQDVNEEQNLHPHQLNVLSQVIKYANYKSAKILDIGCSVGNMLSYLKSKGFENIYGIEMNEYAVKTCVKKKLNARYGDIESLDLKDRYDVIYLNHVLEHIPDLKNFIQKVKEHLVTGGYIIIAVPNIGGIKSNTEEWIGYQFDQHYWHFTPESLANIFRENNFIVEKEFTLSGGRFKSFFYKTFNFEGDSLITVFRYGE